MSTQDRYTFLRDMVHEQVKKKLERERIPYNTCLEEDFPDLNPEFETLLNSKPKSWWEETLETAKNRFLNR